MREIKNECSGSGGVTVSTREALRGEFRCSACGKMLKIRARRDNTATLPRHSREVSHGR